MNENINIDDDYRLNSKKLPINFAENILFLEMEMEKPKIDLQKLSKLLELYAV